MNARTSSLRSLAVAAIAASALLAAAIAGADPAAPAGDLHTRAFDASGRDQVLRVAMATLQDRGFVIEKADAAAGSFTAARIEKFPLRITVTAQAGDGRQVVVRAEATYGDEPVAAPNPYRDFFAALEKAMSPGSHDAD